jgi:hypothetical protein
MAVYVQGRRAASRNGAWFVARRAAGARAEVAANARQQLASGLDPLTVRQKPATMTFAETARALIESMSPAWRNAKHRAQWEMTLTVYCAPIASKAAADITTDDVLRVLKPLWLTKPETGSRLRGRIERALDFAKARGMRSGENPARWRGHLDAPLPKRQKLTRGHHKAMAFDDVPEFFKQLHKMPGIAPAALEFAILTAARSGEVLGGQWGGSRPNSGCLDGGRHANEGRARTPRSAF